MGCAVIKMRCENAATHQIVSKPLGHETSQRENNRLTYTVTDFRRYQGSTMARAILVTMSRNLQGKIECSSLVMRQVAPSLWLKEFHPRRMTCWIPPLLVDVRLM